MLMRVNAMNLFTTLLNISNLQDDQVLFVEQPWTPESETELRTTTPIQNNDRKNFKYFIKVSELKLLMLRFEMRNLCLRDSCYLVIEYALDYNTAP